MVVLQLLLYVFLIPSWLVVSGEPVKADAAIVLGGGELSRLRKAMSLYYAGTVRELILVDALESDWTGSIERLDPGHPLNRKQITVLTGSTSTETDARLSLPFCLRKRFKRVIVVTDPYYSRRADITFRRAFSGSGIAVMTIHTGDFNKLVPPDGAWRSDRSTRDTIWLETGKIASLLIPEVLRHQLMSTDR